MNLLRPSDGSRMTIPSALLSVAAAVELICSFEAVGTEDDAAAWTGFPWPPAGMLRPPYSIASHG